MRDEAGSVCEEIATAVLTAAEVDDYVLTPRCRPWSLNQARADEVIE